MYQRALHMETQKRTRDVVRGRGEMFILEIACIFLSMQGGSVCMHVASFLLSLHWELYTVCQCLLSVISCCQASLKHGRRQPHVVVKKCAVSRYCFADWCCIVQFICNQPNILTSKCSSLSYCLPHCKHTGKPSCDMYEGSTLKSVSQLTERSF